MGFNGNRMGFQWDFNGHWDEKLIAVQWDFNGNLLGYEQDFMGCIGNCWLTSDDICISWWMVVNPFSE